MNNMIKKGIITATALATAATGFTGVAALAQEAETQQYPPFIERLAEHFNLNVDEVKDFFQQEKQTRREYHQQKQVEKLRTRLTAAVESGELTQDQADRIIQKYEKMKANHGEYKNVSPEERRELRQQKQTELKEWAQANNIDLKWLKQGRRHGKKMMHRGNNN